MEDDEEDPSDGDLGLASPRTQTESLHGIFDEEDDIDSPAIHRKRLLPDGSRRPNGFHRLDNDGDLAGAYISDDDTKNHTGDSFA